jgi:amidase
VCLAVAVCRSRARRATRSRDILDTNTLDCFGGAIQKPSDMLALVKGDNPPTGPFYIEGAEVGDTIAIEFLALEVNGPRGIGAFAPGFGAINSTNYTPMINPPLSEHIRLEVINARGAKIHS